MLAIDGRHVGEPLIQVMALAGDIDRSSLRSCCRDHVRRRKARTEGQSAVKHTERDMQAAESHDHTMVYFRPADCTDTIYDVTSVHTLSTS